MVKRCMICGEEAKFKIKGSNEAYCRECAKEHFNDLSLLVKVEKQAKALKKLINSKLEKE